MIYDSLAGSDPTISRAALSHPPSTAPLNPASSTITHDKIRPIYSKIKLYYRHKISIPTEPFMKPSAIVLASLLSFTAAYSQQPAKTASPSGKKTMTIAVAELEGRGLAEGEASTLTDALRNYLINTGVFRVMERGKMDMILKEQGFQKSGACSDEACMVEMGQLLGVDHIITGSIGKVGGTYSTNIRMISIGSGEIVRTTNKFYKGEIDGLLTTIIPQIADEFAGLENVQTAQPHAAAGPAAVLPPPPPPVTVGPAAPGPGAARASRPSAGGPERPGPHFGILGGISIPLGDLGDDEVAEYMEDQNAGFAIRGYGGEARLIIPLGASIAKLILSAAYFANDIDPSPFEDMMAEDTIDASADVDAWHKNIPIMGGLLFQFGPPQAAQFYVMARAGIDIFIPGEITIDMEYLGLPLGEMNLSFGNSTGFAFGAGAGVVFSRHFDVSLNWYRMGERDLNGEMSLTDPLGADSYSEKFEMTQSVMLMNIALGIRF